jgi:hypothetical protein
MNVASSSSPAQPNGHVVVGDDFAVVDVSAGY